MNCAYPLPKNLASSEAENMHRKDKKNFACSPHGGPLETVCARPVVSLAGFMTHVEW